jgi:hypothetical protein
MSAFAGACQICEAAVGRLLVVKFPERIHVIAEEATNRFLAPGTKVRRDYLFNGQQEESEFGIVLHCWRNEVMAGMFDCLIAFFGEKPPSMGELEEQPYILRYAAIGLVVLEEWPPQN